MVVINSFGLCLECYIRASQILNHHKGQVAQNPKRCCDERRALAFLLFAIVLNTKILVVSEMLDAEDVAFCSPLSVHTVRQIADHPDSDAHDG